MGARAFWLMPCRLFVSLDLVGGNEADTNDDTEHQSEQVVEE